MSSYSCGRCFYAKESYRAVGDRPQHAHLCKACWEELPVSIQADYVRVFAGKTLNNLSITREQAKECLRKADEALAKLHKSGWRCGRYEKDGRIFFCTLPEFHAGEHE